MIIVLLNHTACPLVFWLYAVVVSCLVPKEGHRDSNTLLINYVQLSARTHLGIPYGFTQLSRNVDVFLGSFILDVGIALVILVYRSFMISRLSLGVFRSCVRISIAPNSNGSLSGLSVTPRRFSDDLFWAQLGDNLFRWCDTPLRYVNDNIRVPLCPTYRFHLGS